MIMFSLIFILQFSSFLFADEEEVLPYLYSPSSQQSRDLKSENFFNVNLFTGASKYSYSLDVPLGVRNLVPHLNFIYNSQTNINNQPGFLGPRWSLTESYIERDLNYSFLDSSDDGFRLILEGFAYDLIYSSIDNKFHSEIENFLSIENKSEAPNINKNYWILKTKDGASYRFGFNNNSELTSNIYNYTVRWSLDLVNDTYNNSISYIYQEDPHINDSGTVYLDKIKYNNDKSRVIDLIYESSDKPGKTISFNRGNKLFYSRELKEIKIDVNGSLTTKYILGYDNRILEYRNFLKNITIIGSDNISKLPSLNFEYFDLDKDFKNFTSNWYFPTGVYFREGPLNNIDTGLRVIDLNGDGLADLAKSKCTSNCNSSNIQQDVWINNKSGWKNQTNWDLPPVPFSGLNSKDSGARFDDFNGDGFIDIIRLYNETDWLDQSLWLNNGTGFINYTANWSFPNQEFFYVQEDISGFDTGLRVIDLNGDGLADLAKSKCTSNCNSSNIQRGVWLNNGRGFINTTTWSLPPVHFSTDDAGTRFGDVNGDGLLDIIRLHITESTGTSIQTIWLNNGTGFINYTANWSFPVGIFFIDGSFGNQDTGLRIIDVNKDGLIDLSKQTDSEKDFWINNGSGWFNTSNWSLPSDIVFGNKMTRIDDVDGDGFRDIIHLSSSGQKLYLKNSTKDFLLKNITTEFGGIISIDYIKSINMNNTANTNISNLGFNIWVVANITKNNGINGDHNVISITHYNYSGGKYDYEDKEFRGFNYVEEKIGNKKMIHKFHQDDGNKGKEYETQFLDNYSNNYSKKEFIWNVSEQGGYFITPLLEVSDISYDNVTTNPRIKNISYEYDEFGNIIKIHHKGDVYNADDDRYEYFEYLNNSDKWIVNKIKNYTLTSLNNTRIKNTLYLYDGLNYGIAPTKGSLTAKQDWFNNGNNPSTNYTYNSFGNVINETNANGKRTDYFYGIRDTTNTFVDRIVNAKNHITDFNYELGTGNLLWEIDSNDVGKNYSYDVFGRIIKEVRIYDSQSFPTKNYSYEYDGVAPEEIKISHREINNTANTYDEYTFYDGFGNVVQIKKEAEGTRQIVTDTYYNELFKISKQSIPYFVSFNESYSTPDTSKRMTNYTYDVLDRLVQTINPDNTKRNITYFHWNISFINERGNRKNQSMNAFGQIVEVMGINRGEVYVTTYSYNTSGDLMGIKDALNNTFNFTYDSLGRKTSMKDPDMGTWKYGYDAVGNLINQTDNRNKTIYMRYDEINRIKEKNASDGNITYIYDVNKNNTLSQIRIINDNLKTNITINYSYDDRLRKIEEKTQINNLIFVNNWTYDSLDRITSLEIANGEKINHTYNDQNLLLEVNGINITYNEKNQPLSRVYTSSLITNLSYNNENFRLTKIQTDTKQNLNYIYDNVGDVISINDTANNRLYSMGYDELDRLIYTNISDTTNNNEQILNLNFTYNRIGNLMQIAHNKNNLTFYYSNKPIHAPENIRELLYLTDNKKFYLRNSTNNPIAWLSNKGNILLQGSCFSSVSCDNPGADSFIIRNSTNTNVAFINSSGDLCLTQVSCKDNYASCNNAGDGSFIIRNGSNANMSYINRTGSLCLLGSLIQNINVDTGERNYTLTYDNNGNLIQDLNNYYEYDNMNRMIRVREKSVSGVIIEEYLYDGNGKRMMKNVVKAGSNESIYYIGDNFVQVRNSSGIFNTTYYYADNILIAEKDILGKKKYYHPDHLGSTSLITNSTGQIIEETFYLPFGDVLEGGDESRYGYNSKEKDGTGLNYYGARYYKSTQGQFVQADSIIMNIYEPQTLNHYTYVLNNPYKYIDPNGLWAVITGAGGGGGFGIPGTRLSFYRSASAGIYISYDKQSGFDIGVIPELIRGRGYGAGFGLDISGTFFPYASNRADLQTRSTVYGFSIPALGIEFIESNQKTFEGISIFAGVGYGYESYKGSTDSIAISSIYSDYKKNLNNELNTGLFNKNSKNNKKDIPSILSGWERHEYEMEQMRTKPKYNSNDKGVGFEEYMDLLWGDTDYNWRQDYGWPED